MYKKKKNSRLTIIPSTLWLYAVITVLLVLICLFVINQIRHGKDQSKQIEVLRITETEVKNIAVKINERIPNTNTIPESSCYKSAVKFGTGPIYCSNRIRFDKTGMNLKSLDEEISELKLILDSSNVLDFTESSNMFTSFYAPTEHKLIGCSASINLSDYKEGYSFNLDCFGGDFDSFIYPEQADY